MIRRLIILLLIVGCEIWQSPEDVVTDFLNQIKSIKYPCTKNIIDLKWNKDDCDDFFLNHIYPNVEEIQDYQIKSSDKNRVTVLLTYKRGTFGGHKGEVVFTVKSGNIIKVYPDKLYPQ